MLTENELFHVIYYSANCFSPLIYIFSMTQTDFVNCGDIKDLNKPVDFVYNSIWYLIPVCILLNWNARRGILHAVSNSSKYFHY